MPRDTSPNDTGSNNTSPDGAGPDGAGMNAAARKDTGPDAMSVNAAARSGLDGDARAAGPTGAGPAAADATHTVTRTTVRVRRSPRYGTLIGGTIGIFVIASFFLAYFLPVGGTYTHSQVFGYLVLTSIALGLPVGSLIALTLDRLLARTARTLIAEQTGVRAAAGPARLPDAAAPTPPQPARDPSPHDDENH